LAKPSPAL